MKKGGHNRTHGSTDAFSRIDSFYRINRQFARDYAAEINDPDAPIPIDLFSVRVSWQTNRYDKPGSLPRMYWHCPRCSRRVRFLYITPASLLCRACASLNYPSQQQTRSREAESARMIQALYDMGRGDLATGPLHRIIMMTEPPARPAHIPLAEFRKAWRRFCQARDRRDNFLFKDLIKIL